VHRLTLPTRAAPKILVERNRHSLIFYNSENFSAAALKLYFKSETLTLVASTAYTLPLMCILPMRNFEYILSILLPLASDIVYHIEIFDFYLLSEPLYFCLRFIYLLTFLAFFFEFLLQHSFYLFRLCRTICTRHSITMLLCSWHWA
jgi:hypothetical protein